jgi:glucose-6-phosphate 1-dehydrogenase
VTEHADALVFFGATGDLAKKMIFPALYRLVKAGRLTVPVIGVAYSHWTLDQLVARAEESLTTFGGGIDDPAAFQQLVSQLRYVDGDYNDAATFEALRVQLGDAERPVHYLAIPPSLFGAVVAQLGANHCARHGRVVVEKPFGRDLASAQELNRHVTKVFPEHSVCRIDHFLGQEAIINAQYTRMMNLPFESLFDRRHIKRVQITMAEDFGVEDRGAFYDSVGALLDVVQNHLLQVVGVLTMDSPSPHTPDAFRAERGRLLDAVRPLTPADLVRGQYTGYRSIEGVKPDSDTETYVALRLWIDSPRWAGVPLVIRTGKKLPVDITEAVIEFLDPPFNPFPNLPVPPEPARLRIRFHPNHAVGLSLRSMAHGPEEPVQLRELMLAQHEPIDETPYERLLGGALEGNMSLFVRQDTVEASWRVVEGVLHDRPPAHPYEPGSWGPAPAAALLDGDPWYDPS